MGDTDGATSGNDMTVDVAATMARRLDRTQSGMWEFLQWGFNKHPIASIVIAAIGGPAVRKMLTEAAEFTADVQAQAEAALWFNRHGWAVSKFTPTAAYKQALARKLDGADETEIDQLLADAWNSSSAVDILPARIRVLGAEDDELGQIAKARARLVEQALRHHTNGDYAASIPILLAQVEGICRDATTTPECPEGRSFFAKNPKVRDAVIDDATVAGMECGLADVRSWFSVDVPSTGLHGLGSRHGVLHGRDVAYDNYITSTKCVALLVAIWEWANERLGAIAAARHQARYDAHMGSDAVDDNGWRLDRRGFSATRSLLVEIAGIQQLHRDQRGRYGSTQQLLGNLTTAATGLEALTRGVQIVADADRWMASLTSEAGWVFSIGVDHDVTHYADGPTPPIGLPPGDGWRRESDGNWSGDCHW